MVRVAKPEKGKGGIKKLWVKIPIFFLLLLYKIQPRKVNITEKEFSFYILLLKI